jgi:hypothetical protein
MDLAVTTPQSHDLAVSMTPSVQTKQCPQHRWDMA